MIWQPLELRCQEVALGKMEQEGMWSRSLAGQVTGRLGLRSSVEKLKPGDKELL